MFLSIQENQIFQAEISNIKNIINRFKYANERGDMKSDVFDSSKDYPLHNSEDFIPNYPAIWHFAYH
jgi:hypothetical protein